jgi:hypothetical protein
MDASIASTRDGRALRGARREGDRGGLLRLVGAMEAAEESRDSLQLLLGEDNFTLGASIVYGHCFSSLGGFGL